MLSPLVSVVMCTYNGSKFIDDQIISILDQDHGNIELIIADDRSTDDTYEKLIHWQERDERIKIYKNEFNLGYNKNFEHAIQLANGELIALSDQDDIWMPQKISKLAAAFHNPNVTLAHNRSVRLENGRLRFRSASLHYHFKGNDTRRLFMFNQINGHDIMFRRELREKFLPIPDGVMYDWWIAVIATCYGNIASVDKYLVHHRIHSENSFFTKDGNVKKKQLDLEEVLKFFLTIDALSTEARAFLERFLKVLSAHNRKEKEGFDYSLFKFLLKNRKIIFGHNRRLLPEWKYFKSAFKYAKKNYNGKGITL